MSIDKVYNELREQPIELDELQQRRVFWNVMQSRPWPRRSRAPWIAAVAAIAVAAAAVVLVLGVALVDDPSKTPASVGAADDQPTTLSLAGLGRAILQPGADVSIESKTASLLEVAQTGGSVRYEIDRPGGHEVIVRAGGYAIEVVGTVFDVAVDERNLSVRVDEGVVRVEDSRRIVKLVAGDEITMAVRTGAADREEPAAASTGQPPDATEPTEAESQDAARSTATPSAGAPGVKPRLEQEHTRAEPVPGDSDAPASPADTDDGAKLSPPPTIEEMLESVDEARREGSLAEASRLLDQIVRRFPFDRRAINALFTMGNVERQLGNYAKAARAYDRCWQLKPSGLLAEDARAEAAVSWARAGRKDLAAKAARNYLELYPRGNHVARMKSLAE
jgi:TolA-binding protein